jgi:hypothetical protein
VEANESAVIVPIPEAEPAVGKYRASLDRTTAWGIPAHVSVIYPFLPPSRIGPREMSQLREAVRSVPGFDVSFADVCWFDDRVVWLGSDPADGFRALIDAVWAAFPQCPPYGGAFTTTVPHLTVGADGDLGAMSSAARAVAASLPISASVGAARLFQGSEATGGWRSVAELPLG